MTNKPLIGRWIASIGAAAICVATLTPGGPGGSSDAFCIVCGETGGVDVILNTLLFLPLGFGLALIGVRGTRAMISVVAATLAIELLQLRVIPGRDASAGDMLMNCLGGALGFLAARHLDSLVRPTRRAAVVLTLVGTAFFFAVQLVHAYALVPALTPLPYYGQIARDLGPELAGFPGKVLQPMIGPYDIRDQGFTPPNVRDRLAQPEGVPVRASVVATACPATTAGIIHLADSRQHEVLILAQKGTDLIYGIRTGAEVMRLRPVRYRLEGVFGTRNCVVTGDTLALEATLSRSKATLRASGQHTNRAQEMTPRIWESWRLVMPWQTYASGGTGATMLSAIWILALVSPVAYWARRAMPRNVSIAYVIIVVAVGLFATRALF